MASFIAFQREICPTSQREHFQGYVQFVRRATRKSACERLGGSPHCETRRGTHAQALAYATKLETRIAGPYQAGQGVEERVSSGLAVCKDLVDSGAPEVAIAEAHFATWAVHHRAIARYALLRRNRLALDREPPRVHVFYGPPGCGKSRLAREESNASGKPVYWLSQSGAGRGAPQYWDGYDGEEYVVIDEFYGWLPFSFLLRLLDRYPLAVNQRGSQAFFAAKEIWFTSNRSPREWYPSIPSDRYEALLRRIHRTVRWELPAYTRGPLLPGNAAGDAPLERTEVVNTSVVDISSGSE